MTQTGKSRRATGLLRPRGASRADLELKRKIEAHLPSSVRNGRTPEIHVQVKDGFVLLRGRVRTYRVKERIHRFVMALHGVKALKDLLQVEPLETLADRQIALHVRQALDAHSELPPGTAIVQVRSGVCNLRGHVRTAEERHIAELVSRHCRGVRTVVNGLSVDPLDEVSDQATVCAVKNALAYCTDFDIETITASCADGKVLLRGLVPSIMDRALAEEVTRLQPGVRAVENHIQVATHARIDPVTVSNNAGRRAIRRPGRSGLRRSVPKE